MARYRDEAAVERAFDQLRADWDEYLGRFTVETPDPEMTEMLNVWNQVQCRTTLNWSRFVSGYETGLGRGMGTRDSAQDTLGTMHSLPGAGPPDADPNLEPCSSATATPGTRSSRSPAKAGPGLAAEFPTWPQWFSDDHLWLVLATCAYLRETGDLAYLDERAPWADGDDEHDLGSHAARGRVHARQSRPARPSRGPASPTGTTRSTSTTGRARPRASGAPCSSAGQSWTWPSCAATGSLRRRRRGSPTSTGRWRRS